MAEDGYVDDLADQYAMLQGAAQKFLTEFQAERPMMHTVSEDSDLIRWANRLGRLVFTTRDFDSDPIR
jgi:hypothetical protein